MMKPEYYSTKDAADMLSLSPSSVRKYGAELELAGKTFLKTEAGARLFNDGDLATLKAMKILLNKGAKYPEAAEQAARGVGLHELVAPEEAPATAGMDAVLEELRLLREQSDRQNELLRLLYEDGERKNEMLQKLNEGMAVLRIAEIDRQHDEALRLNAPVKAEEVEEEAPVEPAAKPTMEFAPIHTSSKPGFFGRLFGRK